MPSRTRFSTYLAFLQSRYSEDLKKPDLETLMKKMTVCDDEAFFSGHKTETWTEIHYLDEVRFHPTCNDGMYSAFVVAEAGSHPPPGGRLLLARRISQVTVIPSARPYKTFRGRGLTLSAPFSKKVFGVFLPIFVFLVVPRSYALANVNAHLQ